MDTKLTTYVGALSIFDYPEYCDVAFCSVGSRGVELLAIDTLLWIKVLLRNRGPTPPKGGWLITFSLYSASVGEGIQEVTNLRVIRRYV